VVHYHCLGRFKLEGFTIEFHFLCFGFDIRCHSINDYFFQ
jgi:hypothetical protein